MKIKPFNGEVYFHVLSSTRSLMDGRVVEPGHTYHATKPNPRYFPASIPMWKENKPTLCFWGMHASEGLFYDVNCSSWICLVRLWDNVKHSPSKSVAQRRKVIAMRQWNKECWVSTYFGLNWHVCSDGFALFNDGDLQKVADWVLAKPYKNIVAP